MIVIYLFIFYPGVKNGSDNHLKHLDLSQRSGLQGRQVIFLILTCQTSRPFAVLSLLRVTETGGDGERQRP